MMPKVSIIIPTYNRSQRLSEAIDSVIAQTYTNIEIIVIDDGSTDETEEIINSKKASFPILYTKQKNKGVSAARNYGISLASGDYICFLDSDDIWYPQKVQVQLAIMEKTPDIQISQVQEVWMRKGKHVNPMKKHLKPSGDIFIPSLKLCLVSPSAVMIKKTLFTEVGLFDEKMPVCEDYDLWLRISYKYGIYLIHDNLIEKRGGHEDQLSKKYWGMDRFRIYSMEKLLTKKLTYERKEALLSELRIKSTVVHEGARNHNRYFLFLKYRIKSIKYRILHKILWFTSIISTPEYNNKKEDNG
ncbi:MAG: hypothetical protein A2X41_11920 [Candidatus Margulisbacteria bacterium GWE2_39_32]|nr:MAG: hypothetical protein A2X41_11920 [Candidatus Margulisbacteria bacterium GWE2_39_32]